MVELTIVLLTRYLPTQEDIIDALNERGYPDVVVLEYETEEVD